MDRILVVDDEELNRDLLVHLLKDEFETRVAEDGEQALKLAAEDVPDLILLDIQMPMLDGYETCRKLKENEVTRHSPVIFVSSNTQEEEILKGYEVGAADYFVKPFKQDELKLKIHQNIDLRNQHKAFEDRLDEANKVAFQALTDTSAYGVITVFLVDALKSESSEALAELLFNTTSNWGLHCTLQVRTPGGIENFADNKINNPIEDKVLSATVSHGRIVDFGPRTIFNDRHCSLLVKNMPVDDELTYGKYKDYLARLIEGIDGRVAAMIAEQTIRKRTQQIKSVFENMLNAFSGIQEQNYQLRSGSANIIEQMREDMQVTVSEVSVSDDLSEESESRILDVAEACLKNNNDLFDKGIKFNEQVATMISVFEQILQKDTLTETDLEKLVGSLATLEV